LIAALYDVDIFSADIQNAFLTSPCKSKIWTVLGPEFGPNRCGGHALVIYALYGLKSAGAGFRKCFASCLGDMGYISSLGDRDVWFQPAMKVNGEEYDDYLLVHSDYIIL
jgi:hypothetical protein